MYSFPFRSTIIIFIATMSISTAQESFTLEYRFSKGKTYRYRSVGNLTMTNTIKGTTTTTENSSITRTTLTVDEITKNGSFVFISVIDSMLLNGKELPAAMKEIVGTHVTMTVSRRGIVEKFQVIDPIKNASIGSVIQHGNMQFYRFPENPVKDNERWNTAKTETTDVSGSTVILTKTSWYTVTGRKTMNGHPCLSISYSDTSVTVSKGTGSAAASASNGKIIATGVFYFDLKQGVLIADEQHTVASIAVTMPSGMTMHNSHTGNTILTLIE